MLRQKLYVLTYEELVGLIAEAIGLPAQSTDIVLLTSADYAMKGTKAYDNTDEDPGPPLEEYEAEDRPPGVGKQAFQPNWDH